MTRFAGSGDFKASLQSLGKQSNFSAPDYENLQNKINQIKLRYGRAGNENEETPAGSLRNFPLGNSNNTPYNNNNNVNSMTGIPNFQGNNMNVNPTSLMNLPESQYYAGNQDPESFGAAAMSRESVLQKINEMKSKIQFSKK